MGKPPMQGDLWFGFIMGFIFGMIVAIAIVYFIPGGLLR